MLTASDLISEHLKTTVIFRRCQDSRHFSILSEEQALPLIGGLAAEFRQQHAATSRFVLVLFDAAAVFVAEVLVDGVDVGDGALSEVGRGGEVGVEVEGDVELLGTDSEEPAVEEFCPADV